MAVIIKRRPDGVPVIHYFVRDNNGPIHTLENVHQSVLGPIRIGGAIGRVACRPEQNTVATQFDGKDYRPCFTSDIWSAVTCPKCMGTADYLDNKRIHEENEAKASSGVA